MPAQATASPAVVSALQVKLLDPATSLPHKYRILFSLRSVAGAEAEAAILRGAHLLFPLPASPCCLSHVLYLVGVCGVHFEQSVRGEQAWRMRLSSSGTRWPTASASDRTQRPSAF